LELIADLNKTVEALNTKLKTMSDKVSNKEVETKHGMTYLEMKYNLLI
jgi:hypothetical protein